MRTIGGFAGAVGMLGLGWALRGEGRVGLPPSLATGAAPEPAFVHDGRTRVLRIDPQGVVRVDGKVVEVATVVGPASEVVLVPDPGAAYGVVAPVIQAVLAAGAGEVRLEETPAR